MIVKKIVNRLGRPNPTTDFMVHVNGNNPSPTEFPGSTSGVTVFLAPGPYAVTETNPGVLSNDGLGYLASYSPDCVGTIDAGEITECVITNTLST